ncbi:MAG: cytochrome c [Nitrospirae bacterium]|nr:cytochrome c [Nitrospirota bacterium]
MRMRAQRLSPWRLWPWWLAVGWCLFAGGLIERAEAVLGDAVRGRAIFEKNCVACHGIDAKGTGPAAATLPVKPANLTDCRRTAEDDVEMLESIIHHGGPYAGLSSVMPAWDKTLTSVEIADVAAYVKSLCDDADWVPGELSFPRPLITGKAIPEQEVVLGGQLMRAVRNANPNEQSMTFSGAVEYRINGLTEIELEVPVSAINLDPGPSTAGLGDVAVALKRVLFFSVEHLTIVTAALELGLPTGRSSRGLGGGQLVWEPGLRAGWRWNDVILQSDLRLELPQQTANTEAALLYNVALGYEFEPDPRLELVPMVELNTETLLNGADGGRTLSAVLPQLRLKWLVWSAGAGVQFPFTPVKDFDLRVLFDLTYEYSL